MLDKILTISIFMFALWLTSYPTFTPTSAPTPPQHSPPKDPSHLSSSLTSVLLRLFLSLPALSSLAPTFPLHVTPPPRPAHPLSSSCLSVSVFLPVCLSRFWDPRLCQCRVLRLCSSAVQSNACVQRERGGPTDKSFKLCNKISCTLMLHIAYIRQLLVALWWNDHLSGCAHLLGLSLMDNGGTDGGSLAL